MAGSGGRPDASALWEFGLLAIVLTALVWQFQGLKEAAAGDDRYRLDRALKAAPLVGYGNAGVATLCHRLVLPPRLKWRWATACDDTRADQAGSPDALPAALQADHAALQQAILAGAAGRQAAVAPLALSLGEGVLPDSDQERLAETTRELSEYRARYQLGAVPAAGSLPLACAWAEASALVRRAGSDEQRAVALADQLALVRGAAARLGGPAGGSAPDWSPGTAAECRALGAPQRVLAQAADLARQVRDGGRLADKAAAMQRLSARAPWLLAGWSLLTWALVSLARRTRRPLRFLAPALLAWSAMGAASGLVQPDAGAAVPGWVWAAMAAVGVAVGIAGRVPRLERLALFAPCAPQRGVSFLGLPMFVLFVGIGWWLAIDLSLNGHFQNRYIALRHGLAVFGAMLLVSILPVLSQGVATLWMAWAGLLTNALRPSRGGVLGGWLRPLALWGLYAAAVLGLALLARGRRQLSGELLPLLLLLGVSWFFLLRAALWTRPRGGGWRWLATSMLPLLAHVAVVLAALALTDDLGPMLVVLFASAIYAGAFAAQALLGRGARWPLAAVVGMLAAALLAGALLGGLVVFTHLPGKAAERVAERLDSVVDPFSAENDQLAHVLWLGRHTPPDGYGLGAVPWCGTLPVAGCPGIPAQAQSDYSFAVLQAVVGRAAAFGLLAACLLWLAVLAVRQAAQTRGTLAVATAGASQSAWLAWLGVCWAVLTIVQTLVTAAGNLGALPLTGVTWPFVSFGLWSLLRNSLILGLVMNRPETPE